MAVIGLAMASDESFMIDIPPPEATPRRSEPSSEIMRRPVPPPLLPKDMKVGLETEWWGSRKGVKQCLKSEGQRPFCLYT